MILYKTSGEKKKAGERLCMICIKLGIAGINSVDMDCRFR